MAKLFIETSYGIIPNHLLNDVKISLRAKGLYAFIQAKPNEWKFSAERISLETKNGLHSIKKTLQELEKFGYLERKKYQSHNGFWQIEYHLYSLPKNINPSVGFPPSEFQPQENPSVDIPPSENQSTYKTIVY